jgi:hypothetical protein
MKRSVTIALMLVFIALLVAACATPEQRAQKLFDQGKYEEVLAKFPNLPIAQNAKAKIAEKLCDEGKYEEVLANYSDTPAAEVAKEKLAENLFAEGKYMEVCQMYPGTNAAKQAENKIAEKLYNDKNFDELIAKYGNTPFGMKAKNERGMEAYNKTKNMKKSAKEQALRDIMRTYAGTEAARLAQEDMNKLMKAGQPAKPPAPPKKK